jgi:hypothetical protein
MEIKNSPLEILNFFVLKSNFETIPPSEEKEAEKVDVYQHPVNVDFGVNKVDEEVNALFMKVWSNYDESDISEGYSFFVETVTIFRLKDKEKIDKRTIENLQGFSIVGMSYANIRGFLDNISSSFPLGRYQLPSVDLVDLVNKKRETLEKEK